MAARINLRHQDEVRAKIQASQLINVLQNHALSEDCKDLPPSRLKAIEILLRKSIPDLSAVTHSGDENNPLNVISEIRRTIVHP
jgi:hypothetical protein